jgi:Cellulase (glycosyl hydrolase family 5)
VKSFFGCWFFVGILSLVACVNTSASDSSTEISVGTSIESPGRIPSVPGQVLQPAPVPQDSFAFDSSLLQPLAAGLPGGLAARSAPRFGVSAHLQKYDQYHQTATNDTRPYGNPERQRQVLAERSADLRLAREAGFSFVRTDFNWNWVEVIKGSYRFSQADPYYNFDGMVADAAANSLGTMFVLAYNHDFYSSTPVFGSNGLLGISTPEQRLAFANYVKTSVEHFKGKDMLYEVWNEPNASYFWNTPNAGAYAMLAKEAIAAARVSDPKVQISTGGVWTSTPGFIKASVENGALSSGASAFGLHPYRAIPEELIGSLAVSNPNDVNLARVRNLIEPSAEGRPIWNTEWGYSSFEQSDRKAAWKRVWDFEISSQSGSDSGNLPGGLGRQVQAVLGVRAMLTGWLTGMPLMVWYDLRDDGTNGFEPEQNFGLLDLHGKPKPIYDAIKNLLTFSKNRTASSGFFDLNSGMRALGFGTDRTVVWLENLKSQKTLRFGSKLRASKLINGQRLIAPYCGDLEHRCVVISGLDGPLALETELQ